MAVLAARTAAPAVLYNVKINLSAIKDSNFAEELAQEVENLKHQVIRKEKEILADIRI